MVFIHILGMTVSILIKKEIIKNQGHIREKSQNIMTGMIFMKMAHIKAGGDLKLCQKSMS